MTEYDYIKYCLFPNQHNIHNTVVPLHLVNEDSDAFKILIYPVYKHGWKFMKLSYDDTEKLVSLKTDVNKVVYPSEILSAEYTLTDTGTGIILSYKKQIYICNYLIKELNITYSAYSFIILYITKFDDFTLSVLDKLDIKGILETANELGFVSAPKQYIKPDTGKFEFARLCLRSLDYDIQYKVFNIWITFSSCTIQGGTGVGKTSQIPKLFWWFNYLFDGFTQFSKPIYKQSINDFVFSKNMTTTNKYTLLSMPRKALIRKTGLHIAKTMYDYKNDYVELENTFLSLKYKDVSDDKTVSNSNYLQYISYMVISVHRLTHNLFKNLNTIIFDEVHEHDMYCDSAIAIAVNKKKTYNIRNIVLISATISSDIDIINNYFDNLVHINIPGKTLYRNDIYYEPKISLVNIIDKYKPSIGMCMIIFLESISKINTEYKKLQLQYKYDKTIKLFIIHSKVYNLHNVIIEIEQSKNYYNIILCTNILESSITIINAEVVVDNGLMYVKYFLSGKIMYITESMAIQRSGRVGRSRPGKTVRRYKLSQLTPVFKGIDYDYIWFYIIMFKYHDLDCNTAFFIPPSDPKRIKNTVKYLTTIGILSNIIQTYRILNKYECNMPEYIKLFYNNSYKKHLSEFEQSDRHKYVLSNNVLVRILIRMGISCTIKKYFKLPNGKYKIVYEINKYYDGYKNFTIENIYVPKRVGYLICTKPILVTHI